MIKLILLILMTFIHTDICIGANALKEETNNDSDLLLTKLRELHQYHCGETATCGSSEHVEPSEFTIPVPCCIPCSCLSSCVAQQNCCPWSVNGTRGVTELDYPDPVKGESKTNDGLMLDDRDDNVYWNHTGVKEEEQHALDRARFANSTELDTENFENLNMKEREICIRPQVNYKPNIYLDSEAYEMVVTCPDDFKDKVTIDRCTAELDELSLVDMIPMTSKLSGKTYRNKDCLECNEKIQSKQITEWRAEIVSSGRERNHIFFPNPETILDIVIKTINGFTNIHFIPVEEKLTKRCLTYDVMSCNQTGLWDIYDALIEKVCLEGYQLPITSTIENQRLLFKNIACLYCNVGNEMVKDRLRCGYWGITRRSLSSFSLSLNLRSTISNSTNRRILIPAPYIGEDILRRFPHRSCQRGMVYIHGRCRTVICPRDHYAVENKCIPLYDTLERLDLHIQIQVTPSQAIPSDMVKVFVDELKQITEKVLRNEIRIEWRQVSLWRLPRSNTNLTQYYLLDVYLFSLSNIIDYSSAVGQIKQFLLKLKTGVKLSVLDPLNIKLDFQFKHGLTLQRKEYKDMIEGRNLQPLMGKGWALIDPLPHITISEVNWCFRAPFDLKGLEYFKTYIRVKSTDNIVYQDQYERQMEQFYLCIDPFEKELLNKDDKSDTDVIENGKTAIVYDNGVSDKLVVDSERGLIVTFSVVMVILFLVILLRVKKANTERQPQESAGSNQQYPSDDIELNVLSD